MFDPTYIQEPTLGSRAHCAWCDKEFRLQRRAQRFCCARCQKTGRRAELAVGAFLPRPLGGDTGVGGFCPKNASAINAEKLGSARLTPLNLLGGFRWSGATPIEPALWRAIVRAEIGGPPRAVVGDMAP
jgi:hypothetical protein